MKRNYSSLFNMFGTIFQKSRLTNSLGIFGRGAKFVSSEEGNASTVTGVEFTKFTT
jgi:hypothetical protein